MVERNIRILLADDHPVVATGLKLACRQSAGFSYVGAAITPERGLSMAAAERPDAVVLDLVFEGQVHLQLIGDCRRLLPEAVIVVFSSLPARTYRQEALAAGADAFVGKDSDLETLVEVIANLIGKPRRPAPDGPPAPLVPVAPEVGLGVHLTPRERDVARLLSRGTPMAEIGRALGVSVKTASVHRDNLRLKLQCRDTNELIARLARVYVAAGDP